MKKQEKVTTNMFLRSWMLKKIGAAIILGTISILSPPIYSQQNININGTVTGTPNNNNINGAKVVAIRTDNNARIDSTNTNSYGNYALNFLYTGTQNLEKPKQKIYPNPCNSERTIQTNTPKTNNYTLQIFNIKGQTILQENIHLNQGNNEIKLQGGNAGIYFITLSDEKSQHTYKSIQMKSTNNPITYTLTETPREFKNTLEDILKEGDQIKLEFTYPNTNPKNSYNPKDTTFTLTSNQTIDQKMQQTPYTFTTTIKTYLDDGKPITTIAPGWTTTFEFPVPVGTKNYTPDGNNEINIQEELFPLNGELGNVTISHDTTNYTVNSTINGVLSWIVLREQNQSTAVRNKAQSGGSLIAPDPSLTTTLDSLDGRTLNYYTLPKNAETQPGTTFRMDHTLIAGFMAASGNGAQTSKFIEVPPYGHLVLMKTVYDNDLTKFPTQANMDRTINEYNKAINLCIMHNNDNITQPTQFFYTTMNDSIWNAVQSRNPLMDNTLVLAFYQGPPSVSRSWVATYTYDEKARIKATKAKYSESATNGQIFTENYSATYGIEEGSGSLGPYVYIGTTGQPTDLAGRMGRWVKILDLGSGQDTKK